MRIDAPADAKRVLKAPESFECPGVLKASGVWALITEKIPRHAPGKIAHQLDRGNGIARLQTLPPSVRRLGCRIRRLDLKEQAIELMAQRGEIESRVVGAAGNRGSQALARLPSDIVERFLRRLVEMVRLQKRLALGPENRDSPRPMNDLPNDARHPPHLRQAFSQKNAGRIPERLYGEGRGRPTESGGRGGLAGWRGRRQRFATRVENATYSRPRLSFQRVFVCAKCLLWRFAPGWRPGGRAVLV